MGGGLAASNMPTPPCTDENSQLGLDLRDPRFRDPMFGPLAGMVAWKVATTCKDGWEMMKGVKSTPPSSPTKTNGNNPPWAPKAKKRKALGVVNGTELFPVESMN